MRPSTTFPGSTARPRSGLRRHRPRMPILARPAGDVRTSDLVLAITGIGVLAAFCLILTAGLLGGVPPR